MLHGVDISHYQGQPNWDALKGAVDFVIMKSSGGCPDPGQTVGQYTDGQLRRNQSEARRVGILRGYYHYCYPTINDPVKEADCFCDAVGQLQDGEVMALDLEGNVGNNPVGWAKTFLDHVASRTGVKPVIYLNKSLASSYDWSPVINGNYGLWLADYTYNANAPMNPNTHWPFVAFTQYSNHESIAGLSPVDGDIFYGTAESFKKYGYQAPMTVVPPAPEPAPVIPVPVEPTPIDSVVAPVPVVTQVPTEAPVEPPVKQGNIMNKLDQAILHMVKVLAFIALSGAATALGVFLTGLHPSSDTLVSIIAVVNTVLAGIVKYATAEAKM